jgi:uncharacterized protein (DUF1800 family)
LRASLCRLRGIVLKRQQPRSVRSVSSRCCGVRAAVAAGALAVLFAACGGGSSSSTVSSSSESLPPPTQTESARFLTQATIGPNEASMASLTQQGYSAWLAAEFAKPQTLHRTYMDAEAARLAPNGSISANTFYESWWKQAITGDDQLRQRVAFALSQIFVVSFADPNLNNYPRGVASYYDMLGEKAATTATCSNR